MPKRSDPVEALDHECERQWRLYNPRSSLTWEEAVRARNIQVDAIRLVARAAIAHLSKPAPRKPGTIRQRVAAINRIGNAKPKRGAKRGK